jgi:hypothetical protein
VGTADGSHEVNDGNNHQPRGDHASIEWDLTLTPDIDNSGSGGNADQEEGAQRLGEEATPLEGEILEISSPGSLESFGFEEVEGLGVVLTWQLLHSVL